MPYGYDVANAKLPQAADPIGSALQGGIQGITLGLGLQRARQDAQTNQLQQQAAMEEMKNKELDMLGKAAERIKKAENPILKQFYWDTYFVPIVKNRIGSEIDIPDEYSEQYEDSLGALAEGFKNAENDKEKDVIFGRVLSDARKRGEDLDSLFKYREAVMPKKNVLTDYQIADLALKKQALDQKRSPAQNVVDREYGKDYADYVSGGGYADVLNQITTLEDIKNKLGKGGGYTGPAISMVPDSIRKRINPGSIEAQQAVEQSVQRSLKQTLGGQFTEKEGALFMQRGYDPALPEEENIKKLTRMITQLKSMAAAKQEAMDYFEQHGTLTGYKGSIYTLKNGEIVKVGKDGFYEMMGINKSTENLNQKLKFSDSEEVEYQKWKKQQTGK